MPYTITFEPLNPIKGVKPKSVEFATASEAWAQAQGLMASDEKATVLAPGGYEIGLQELKMLANEEAN